MLNLFGISFYGYGLLIGLGVWVAMEIALANGGKINKKILEKAMWCSVISGVIGARLYHVIDYWDRYYSTNLIKILFFWEGGLGIWGAIGGGALGLLIFCYFNKLKFIKMADILVIGIPLAQTIGRLGNWVNGELYGKNGEPLFAYEGGLNLVLFLILWKISRKQNRVGLIFGIYFVGYGVIRILLENLRSEANIWKLYGVPVAIIFGLISIMAGVWIATVRVRNSQ
jgi:phosphatidylglycerol---prolipoprotein diacylglyceryl transferase